MRIKLVIPSLLKRKTVLVAIFLAMAISALSIIASIYAYSIFLSNYPAHWLIYFMVLQALSTSLIRAAALYFLKNNIKKSTLLQLGVFTVIFIICVFAMSISVYAIPFIVAIVIFGIQSSSAILSWNLFSNAFGMREYQTIATYINQAAYASSIISSFLVPLLVLFFSNISLLICSTILLCISMILIYKLPVLEQEPKKHNVNKKTKQEQIKYPLYRYFLFFFIAVAAGTVFSQYLLRYEAAAYYSKEELSAFLGLFSGITSFVGLGVAFSSQWVVKRLGLEAILYSEPLFILLAAILVIVSPGLWSTIILGSSRNIFGYSYGDYSIEIILNILPARVRVGAKSNIKSIASITSTLLLSVFAAGTQNTRQVALLIPVFSLTAIYLTYKIKQYYKITLQQESAFKRYNIQDEIFPETASVFKEIALKSIESNDVYTILYGLDLFYRLKLTHLPVELYNLLKHPAHTVRYAVIQFLIQTNSTDAIPYLQKQLVLEKDHEIEFTMIEGIATLDLDSAINAVHKLPDKNYEIILIQLFSFINTGEKNKALPSMRVLAKHPEPFVRKMIALLIGTFKITQLNEVLEALIKDPNKEVSSEAFLSVAKAKVTALIPQIISELKVSKETYSAQDALASLGSEALPYLFSEVFDIKLSKVFIKTIAAIPDLEAEQVLFDIILKKGHPYYRNIVAEYANKRTCTLSVSDQFKKHTNQLAEEEAAIIFHLKNQINSEIDQHIQLEIQQRIDQATKRFVQWIAISSWTREVNKLLASLMQSKLSTTRLITDKALELLEIYISDKKNIRACVKYIFEEKELDVVPTYPTTYHDPWLEQIMNEKHNKSPLLSIVFALRAVRLFKDVPAEILLAIAEEVQLLSFSSGEIIFSENDAADGLYCVNQGEVNIIRGGKQISTVGEHGFFGELALLDEATRVGSAIAKTDCSLLYIEKDVFNRIADDVPDVLRTVMKVILEYLRKNLEQAAN